MCFVCSERHLLIAIDDSPNALTIATAKPWDREMLRGIERVKGKTFCFRTLSKRNDPKWNQVKRIETYSNGKLIRSVNIIDEKDSKGDAQIPDMTIIKCRN